MLEYVIVIMIIVPVILFPAAFIWYINVSGLYQVIKDRRRKKKKF
ncbi:MAG: hypothetical protein V1870_02650 [Candidatus Aenigmatarchaeota archaeon]